MSKINILISKPKHIYLILPIIFINNVLFYFEAFKIYLVQTNNCILNYYYSTNTKIA